MGVIMPVREDEVRVNGAGTGGRFRVDGEMWESCPALGEVLLGGNHGCLCSSRSFGLRMPLSSWREDEFSLPW